MYIRNQDVLFRSLPSPSATPTQQRDSASVSRGLQYSEDQMNFRLEEKLRERASTIYPISLSSTTGVRFMNEIIIFFYKCLKLAGKLSVSLDVLIFVVGSSKTMDGPPNLMRTKSPVSNRRREVPLLPQDRHERR